MAQVAAFDTASDTHQVLARVIPGLLIAFALVLTAFGLPKLLRRRPPTDSPTATAHPPADADTEPATVPPPASN